MTHDTFERGTPDEQAANWYARLNSDECTHDDRARFAAWRSDPVNASAYDQTERTLAMLDNLRGQIELQALKEPSSRPPARRQWRFAAGAGLALAAALAVAASVLQAPTFGPEAQSVLIAEAKTYTTLAGAIDVIDLPDQSEMHLGSDSRAVVHFSGQERKVILEEGQAYFDVVRDPRRPFEVRAGNRSVVALGTAFDVRVDGARVDVTLVEGGVAIMNSADRHLVTLRPGERYSLDGGRESVRAVNAVADTAWRNGVLNFNDVSLAEAVADFNRNSAVRIVLADSELGILRIGGRFRTGDAEAFAGALEALYPIERKILPDGSIELQRISE